jgi:NDP-sugar pyrophosphorylase family protein
VVLEMLRRGGVQRATLAVGYPAEQIQAICGDGQRVGQALDYSLEPRPLGTAGSLALLAAGQSVWTYIHAGYWLDIGSADDYQQAQVESARLLARLAPA